MNNMAIGRFRIGNRVYAPSNGSCGYVTDTVYVSGDKVYQYRVRMDGSTIDAGYNDDDLLPVETLELDGTVRIDGDVVVVVDTTGVGHALTRWNIASAQLLQGDTIHITIDRVVQRVKEA